MISSVKGGAAVVRRFCRGMKIYTKTGDKGTSSLYTGERRSKDDAIFMALGDTDELNAMLGVVRSTWNDNGVKDVINVNEQLIEIQSRLFDVGSAIATPRNTPSKSTAKKDKTAFEEHHVTSLESWIDGMEESLPPLKNFILPSGGQCASHAHVARAICRRAERRVVSLVAEGQVEPSVGIYLNRLSDYLFVAARYSSSVSSEPETLWTK